MALNPYWTGDAPDPTPRRRRPSLADDVVAWVEHYLPAAHPLDAYQVATLRAFYGESVAGVRPRRACVPPRPRSRLLITRPRR